MKLNTAVNHAEIFTFFCRKVRELRMHYGYGSISEIFPKCFNFLRNVPELCNPILNSQIAITKQSIMFCLRSFYLNLLARIFFDLQL